MTATTGDYYQSWEIILYRAGDDHQNTRKRVREPRHHAGCRAALVRDPIIHTPEIRQHRNFSGRHPAL
jgi:hypothetical protein